MLSRGMGPTGLAIAVALAGCYSEVIDSRSSTGSLSDAPLCGPNVDALVTEAGDAAGSVSISNDDTGLDFALATATPMANVRIYVGVPPSDGGPVPFGWSDALGTYDVLYADVDQSFAPAATAASFHVGWPETERTCGQRVKLIVKVTFEDGTVAWAHSAEPYQSYENVHWDYYTACEDSCSPPDGGCTLTQGFWKNHPEAWPVTSLTLGTVTYSQAELLALFATKPRGDASIILAHQLIAAKLNVAAGAAEPGSATADADAWLAAGQAAGYDLPFGRLGSRDAAIAIAATLDAYNNGDLGPLHCDD